MKDRVREAIFNLLGPPIRGVWAIDLFAGTGALGLEALSRGAAGALFLERHFPTAAVIRENIATLGVGGVCEVAPANTLIWIQQAATLIDLATAARQARPWVVFCSPPYQLYLDEPEAMVHLLATLQKLAPPGSVIVVECDAEFDLEQLPQCDSWVVREYPPAVIAIYDQPVGGELDGG